MTLFDSLNLKKTDLKVGKLYKADRVKMKAILKKMAEQPRSIHNNAWFDTEANQGSYHFWTCPLYLIPMPSMTRNLTWEMFGSTYEYRHADTTVFDFASYVYLGISGQPKEQIGRHMFLCKDRLVIFNLPGASSYILKPMCENS